MYDIKEIGKIIRKLELIKNKILLTNGNELILITDWVISNKRVDKTNFWGKKTTSIKYYVELIDYMSKNISTNGTLHLTWVIGCYECTHKGINTLVGWRSNWLNIKEQLNPIGYKLTKIQV